MFTEWIENVKEGTHENGMYPNHGNTFWFKKLTISEDEKNIHSAGCMII